MTKKKKSKRLKMSSNPTPVSSPGELASSDMAAVIEPSPERPVTGNNAIPMASAIRNAQHESQSPAEQDKDKSKIEAKIDLSSELDEDIDFLLRGDIEEEICAIQEINKLLSPMTLDEDAVDKIEESKMCPPPQPSKWGQLPEIESSDDENDEIAPEVLHSKPQWGKLADIESDDDDAAAHNASQKQKTHTTSFTPNTCMTSFIPPPSKTLSSSSREKYLFSSLSSQTEKIQLEEDDYNPEDRGIRSKDDYLQLLQQSSPHHPVSLSEAAPELALFSRNGSISKKIADVKTDLEVPIYNIYLVY